MKNLCWIQDIREVAGELLVVNLIDQQSLRLLKLQKIGDIEVDVSHTSLNTTKGVVVFRDLLNCTEGIIPLYSLKF